MTPTKPSSRRRLQRKPDFTGGRLATFRAVFLRHGLPGIILAIGFALIPEMQSALIGSLEKAATTPARYLGIGIIIAIGLNIYAWRIDRFWDIRKFGWIAYLGVLSLWEEWVFRIAIPQTVENMGTPFWPAAALSALLFASAHYFTLRWKLKWCIWAFIGSLALSRQMMLHDDLLLITAFHWVATFLNTPRRPGQHVPPSA